MSNVERRTSEQLKHEVQAGGPGPVLARGLVLALVLAGAAFGAEVKVVQSAGAAKVSVIRRVDLDYHLVTRARPLEFDVQGPAWVRVYTRLWWTEGGEKKREYRMSLWQEDVERSLGFETELSSSSYGPDRQPVGRWRSFYIQVPKGTTRYRLALGKPAGTVGVRFSFEKPRSWQLVEMEDLKRLVLGRLGVELVYYELKHADTAGVWVAGPCRLRLRARLNFTPELEGAQNFVVAITEHGREVAGRSLRTSRSTTAGYQGTSGYVPSNEHVVEFHLGEGEHRLGLSLTGTLARSAGIRLERIAGEKYE